jgi:hypothetical protein
MKKIFISQPVLDSMFEQGKAHLDQDRLMIHSKQNQVFKMIPACKFLYVADGSQDPHRLLGKILTRQDLEKIHADLYMDSVIYKEVAYQVEPGYLGLPETEAAAATTQKVAAAAGPQADEATDAELLGDYLLKIL